MSALFKSALLTALTGIALAQSQTTLPKADPFYATPAGINYYPLGDIIDWRSNIGKLQYTFGPGTPAIQNAWQIKYATLDAQGNKVAAVTTLLQPFNSKIDRLVSYQAAYDSSDLDCSPSYLIGSNASADEPLPVEQGVISLALQQGYWVNIPDYEGLTASFTSGLTSGRATLDAVRAARRSTAKFGTGLSATAIIGLIGYSGGSIATEWAAELQASYAGELNSSVAAIVIGGVPVEISRSLQKLNAQSQASLIPSALQGLASAYPSFARYLYGRSRLTSLATQQAFNASMASCQNAGRYQNQDIFGTYLATSIDAFLAESSFVNASRLGGIMGRYGAPRHPTYVFQGSADEIVDSVRVTELVNQYCGTNWAGFTPSGSSVARTNVSIKYVLDVSNANHAGAAVRGFPAAFSFLQTQFGNPQPNTLTGCTYTTMS